MSRSCDESSRGAAGGTSAEDEGLCFLRMGRGQGQYVGGIVEWVVEGELQTG